MKKLLVLMFASLCSGIIAGERAIVAFDPSSGQSSVPGGSALAHCADEAMQRVQKSPHVQIKKEAIPQDYEQQRILFLKVQEGHSATLKDLQEKAEKLGANAQFLEQIEKAQISTTSRIKTLCGRMDKVEPRLTALEIQIKDLLLKPSSQSSSQLIKDTLSLRKILDIASAHSDSRDYKSNAKSSFHSGIYSALGNQGDWGLIIEKIGQRIVDNIEAIAEQKN